MGSRRQPITYTLRQHTRVTVQDLGVGAHGDSTASLISSQSQSSAETIDSRLTGSTVSTVHFGIGSSTGTAIRALGKTVLRRLEPVIYRRRLANIEDSFPRMVVDSEYAISKDARQMHLDLLELSRPGIYPVSICKRALALLVAPILQGRIERLVEAVKTLDALHPMEVQLIVPTLFAAEGMPDWQILRFGTSCPDTLFDRRVRHCHFLCNFEEWLAVVRFATHIIRISSTACRAVLDAGYLGILDGMLPNTPSQFVIFEDLDTEYKIPFLDACGLSFKAISLYPEYRSELLRHPVRRPWDRLVQQGALGMRIERLLSPDQLQEMGYQGMYFYCSIPDLCNGFSRLEHSTLLYSFKLLLSKTHEKSVQFVKCLFRNVEGFKQDVNIDGRLLYEAQTLSLLHVIRFSHSEYLDVFLGAGLLGFLLARLRSELLPEAELPPIFEFHEIEQCPPSLFKPDSALYSSILATVRVFRDYV